MPRVYAKKKTTCHPDRPHFAFGLCRKCWKADYNKKHPPTPTYTTWADMKQRCLNRKAKQFIDYGGRGITICKRWLEFKNFLADMGVKPDGKTLERKNNNGSYSPDNCRWATRKEQSNNMRTNIILSLNGKTKTASEWSREIGIKAHTIHCRLLRGWTVKEALSLKPRGHGKRVRQRRIKFRIQPEPAKP